MIISAITGNNSDLFPDVIGLYVREGSTVADVTFGKGVFWRNIDEGKYNLLPTDLQTGVDFHDLPYEDDSIDALVLDPPYMPTEKTGVKEKSDYYGIKRDFGKLKWYDRVLGDYHGGIKEADRVLKQTGILIIKTQDMVCANQQRLTHVDIINFCDSMAWVCEDLFVLVQYRNRKHPAKRQVHARKNHSYFLVFRRSGKKWDGFRDLDKSTPLHSVT